MVWTSGNSQDKVSISGDVIMMLQYRSVKALFLYCDMGYMGYMGYTFTTRLRCTTTPLPFSSILRRERVAPNLTAVRNRGRPVPETRVPESVVS